MANLSNPTHPCGSRTTQTPPAGASSHRKKHPFRVARRTFLVVMAWDGSCGGCDGTAV
nr:hypothetical protein [Tanacetum cinerariifolium]